MNQIPEYKPHVVQGPVIRAIFLAERDRSKLREFKAVLAESLLFAVFAGAGIWFAR